MTTGAASAAAITQAKSALRQAILKCRDAADVATRQRDSKSITRKLCALPAYRAAQVVAAYASFGSELETSDFLATVLADGKRLLLPRINRALRCLELRHTMDLDMDLVAGIWGIREPAGHCALISPDEVDFMLVPGVAFTMAGARLGYGGGFYDRLLAGLDRRTARIGAAFQLQIVDRIPEAAHDQRVDLVVTQD